MKREVRLYNVIFPIWLLWLFPQTWLVVIPGNLAIDCLVLAATLRHIGHPDKKTILKQLWWKFWLLGFAADFAAVAFLFAGACFPTQWLSAEAARWVNTNLSGVLHNAFASPLAFLWTLAAVALAGACIYVFDKGAMKSCCLLSEAEKHKIALAMAVVTAPWLFFIPVY